MINHRNEEQPIYKVHKLFYQEMKEYVRNYVLQTGEEPSQDSFRQAALTYLSKTCSE